MAKSRSVTFNSSFIKRNMVIIQGHMVLRTCRGIWNMTEKRLNLGRTFNRRNSISSELSTRLFQILYQRVARLTFRRSSKLIVLNPLLRFKDRNI